MNESYLKFSVNRKGDIRFGLGAIKGVGESAVQSILEERERNGEYKDIFDFVQRVNLSACNRKNIENLALAGAFDSFTGIKREDFFVKNAKDETFTEVLVRYGNKYQMDKAAAANSLFGGENQVDIATPEIIPSPAWGDLERLNKERDLVGIYLSAHPLDEYAVILENVCNVHMAELADLTPLQNRDLTMGGIVSAVREGYTKTGKPYGIAKVEDYSGSAEFAFFGNEWVEKKNFFMTGMFLFMRGKCQPKQWRQEEYNQGSLDNETEIFLNNRGRDLPSQLWIITESSTGGYWQITSVLADQSIDNANRASQPGPLIQWSTSPGNANQEWKLTPVGGGYLYDHLPCGRTQYRLSRRAAGQAGLAGGPFGR